MEQELLSPLFRVPFRHDDNDAIEIRERKTSEFFKAFRIILDERDEELKALGITDIVIGGSRALDIPRHPHDTDLYLEGDYDIDDAEGHKERRVLLRSIMEEAAESVGYQVNHIYVRDEDSKAPGLNKVKINAPFAASELSEGSVFPMVEDRYQDIMLDIQIHHERKTMFLEPVAAEDGFRRLDPTMVVLQKLCNLVNPKASLKATDILDIAHLTKQGVFNPADPKMRKLSIATFASDGLLRDPVKLDFLVEGDLQKEAKRLRFALSQSISKDLLGAYTDQDLQEAMATVRKAVREIYQIRKDADLERSGKLQDMAELTKGEEDFIKGIFEGSPMGNGSPRARIRTDRLFEGFDGESKDMVDRIQRDMGLLKEVAKTNKNLPSKGRTMSH